MLRTVTCFVVIIALFAGLTMLGCSSKSDDDKTILTNTGSASGTLTSTGSASGNTVYIKSYGYSQKVPSGTDGLYLVMNFQIEAPTVAVQVNSLEFFDNGNASFDTGAGIYAGLCAMENESVYLYDNSSLLTPLAQVNSSTRKVTCTFTVPEVINAGGSKSYAFVFELKNSPINYTDYNITPNWYQAWLLFDTAVIYENGTTTPVIKVDPTDDEADNCYGDQVGFGDI